MHPDGLEPPTYSSVDCRSIQLSYGCFLLRTWTIGYNLVLARLKSEYWSNNRLRGRQPEERLCALSFALPMGLPVRGSDPRLRLICLMPTTRLLEKAMLSDVPSQNSRRAGSRSEVRSLGRRDPVCGMWSRRPSLASRLFCFANAIANPRGRR